MLNRIIRFSLSNRLFVVASAAFVVAYGGWVVVHLPVDVFPDLNKPTVTVMTEAGGLAPEEVETLVTLPIEVALNGMPGLERVRSSSGPGLSVVYLEFAWGTDVFRNRQLVSEKLNLAREQLPEGATPVMGPISSIMGEIQLVGLSAPGTQISPMELRSLADWTIRPRLLSIKGIAQIVPIGGGVRQYQILLSTSALLRTGLTLEEVQKNLRHLSENTTGGFLDVGEKEFLVRNLGRVDSLESIGESVVGMSLGKPVLVKDIAEVKFGPQIKRGEASVNGEPAVILSVQKQPGASTTELTKEVSLALIDIQKTLPKGVVINPDLFKQADFIERAIRNVKDALLEGSILVAIVLSLLLVNFRTTAITLTAIPLSFVVAAIVFKIFGLSINTMTLGGLAVAIGEVVDDAIVDVENVFRRLKENFHSSSPRPSLKVIYEASSEVRNSIVFATIIVILVFIPLFAMEGLEGKLFAPLGIAYVVSLVASLFVSLTVTPALASYLLPRMKSFREKQDGLLVRFLKRWDEKILRRVMGHPKIVIGSALGLLAVSLLLLPTLGKEFLPRFNEGTATYNILLQPGVSLEASNRFGTLAEKTILGTPEVKSVSRRTGRAEMDEHAEGVHYSEIEVDFKPGGRNRDVVMEEIRANLIKQIPGAAVSAGQPISHRLDHLLSGVRAQIAIKVFGSDMEKLRGIAGQIRNSIKDVKGLVDLQVEPQVVIPQLKIQILREDAKKYGLVVGDLASQLETALQGKVVGQVVEDQRIFNIFMRLGDASRADLDGIRKIPVKIMPDGTKVTLEKVADVFESEGPNIINRENLGRRIVVQANTAGRDLNSVIGEVQSKIGSSLTLPEGYFIQYGGQFESQQKASRLMYILGTLSILGVCIVLYSHFRSGFITFQILLNVPMALIGSVFAIWLSDGLISVASMVAFVTLCGIASRNGIMMLSHYLHLMRHEGEKFSQEMVIRGSLERLVPVLSTALTSILALIPLVLSKGEPGKEILYPLGIVVTGGLFSSTLLDMWVTPVVFYWFGRPSAERYLKQSNESPFETNHLSKEENRHELP